MKKSVMTKWVKALRSGKYNQGGGYLKKDNYYCCLGILCAFSPHKKNFTKMKNVGKIANFSLPVKIMKWSGLKTDTGVFSDNICLTSMNDEGKDFNHIADFIEKNWRKL